PDDDAVGYPGLEQGPYGDQAVDQPFRGVPLGGGRLGGGDPGGAFGAPVGERREGTGPGGGRARFGGVLVGQQCDQRGGVRRVADRGGAGGQPLQRLGRLLGRGGGDAGPPALVVAPGGLHDARGGEGRGPGGGPQGGGEPGRVAAQGRLAARGERHQEPAVPGGGLAGRDRRLLQDEVHVGAGQAEGAHSGAALRDTLPGFGARREAQGRTARVEQRVGLGEVGGGVAASGAQR